jgi:hypothetical protein
LLAANHFSWIWWNYRFDPDYSAYRVSCEEKVLMSTPNDDTATRDRESYSRSRSDNPLSDSEYEELQRLRAEKDAPKQTLKEQQAAEEAEEAKKPTHWLLLGNGRTIESRGTMTHYRGMPVVASTLIPTDLSDYEKGEENNNEAK